MYGRSMMHMSFSDYRVFILILVIGVFISVLFSLFALFKWDDFSLNDFVETSLVGVLLTICVCIFWGLWCELKYVLMIV